MANLLENVTNSIWHAFNALQTEKTGNVMKSKLKVLTANIGTLLDLYGVEKGLEHFRSTPSLNFHHYKYYLLKEVFSSLPDSLTLPSLRQFESRIDEVCWLICKKNFVQRSNPILPDQCVYSIFRVFCMLADLSFSSNIFSILQVVLHSSEVALVASQLVTSLGLEWNENSFAELSNNTVGFRFSTMLTILETKYFTGVEQDVLIEVVTDLCHTFVDDVIKKGVLLKRGYLLPTMREYWCVLQPTQLTYYKSSQSEQLAAGCIQLDAHCWVDSTTHANRLMLHTNERCFEFSAYDHKTRLQWVSALQLAIHSSADSIGYQRQLAQRRRRQRDADLEERRRRSSLMHDMGAKLHAEKMARVAAELQAQEIKEVKEKEIEMLGTRLEEETQAKRDEEIVRNLQARVLREEWEKREELEQLQEEQRLMLEEERRLRLEFEEKQREKELQLQEAQRKLKELEAERERLDMELKGAKDKIYFGDQSNTAKTNSQVKVRRTMSFMPSTRDGRSSRSPL
ncbi:differentially expressed in FDCP 6 homolog [Nilaparvata lugens]|uniref:differentially expressed in FDCP 6 homolog n=1 Tax=Nilaparvata lugens TaxID=108931 RepID=UPI00193EB1FF|nr:differentially expressed in FDCP 6 homolog [Nilaparvata lugens]